MLTLFIKFITTLLTTWKSPFYSFPQGHLVLPTYKKDGQEVVKHRAFILHTISKEDNCLSEQPTEFIRENDSKGNWLKSLVYTTYIVCMSTFCIWLKWR